MIDLLPILLRPFVSFCLRHSIKLGEVLEALKSVYVELAREEIQKRGALESGSKVSVMTGVHRKDVTRLMDEKPVSKASKSLAARVIGYWRNSSRFCGASGKPRVLSVEGKQSEFVDLVESVSVDINPYTLLFELERIGAVERTRGGIKLSARLYNPKGNVKEGMSLLASDMSDLVLAVEENIEGKAPPKNPNLHIKTEYDNIPENRVSEIRTWFLKEGSAFHQRARNYLSQFDRDIGKKSTSEKGRFRVAVGSFSRVEKFSEEDAS